MEKKWGRICIVIHYYFLSSPPPLACPHPTPHQPPASFTFSLLQHFGPPPTFGVAALVRAICPMQHIRLTNPAHADSLVREKSYEDRDHRLSAVCVWWKISRARRTTEDFTETRQQRSSTPTIICFTTKYLLHVKLYSLLNTHGNGNVLRVNIKPLFSGNIVAF